MYTKYSILYEVTKRNYIMRAEGWKFILRPDGRVHVLCVHPAWRDDHGVVNVYDEV